jgi:REP element-mobilizing transposase RayT
MTEVTQNTCRNFQLLIVACTPNHVRVLLSTPGRADPLVS